MIMDIAHHQLRATDMKMSTLLENSHAANNNNNNNKIRDLSMTATSNPTNVTVTKKRSFDVAFLMQPDEKLSKVDYTNPSPRKMFHAMDRENNIAIKADALLRQMGSPNSSVVDDTSSVGRNSTDSPTNEEIDIMTNGNSNSSFESANPIDTASIQESVRYFRTQVNRNMNQSTTNSPRIFATNSSPSLSDLEVHRSAFTKVPGHVRLESPPVPPMSPDRVSCSSISPPAVSTTPPRQFANFRSASSGDYIGFPGQFTPFMQQSPAHHHPHHYPGHPGLSMNTPPGGDGKQHQLKPQHHQQPQYFYRPPSSQEQQQQMRMDPNGYSHFPMMTTSTPPASPQMHPFSNELARHPAAAAALLSTLIPPSIASSFSLAAQNVCAKCNISFRMTSDLVYHMRSHHKSENVNESYRRKREDKLKCPVCNESFRERHHLTRHMTAHQDKASDDAEPPQAARNGSGQMVIGQEFHGHKGRHSGLFQSIAHNKGH